jgi:hypothetical protein
VDANDEGHDGGPDSGGRRRCSRTLTIVTNIHRKRLSGPREAIRRALGPLGTSASTGDDGRGSSEHIYVESHPSSLRSLVKGPGKGQVMPGNAFRGVHSHAICAGWRRVAPQDLGDRCVDGR